MVSEQTCPILHVNAWVGGRQEASEGGREEGRERERERERETERETERQSEREREREREIERGAHGRENLLRHDQPTCRPALSFDLLA